jgi:Cu-Zn family superoxide dismutase
MHILTPSALVAAMLAVACASNPTRPERPRHEAAATLRDATGRAVGTVRLTQTDGGALVVDASVTDLAAGPHGIHLHAVGSCEATGTTAFGAAGGHFNPTGAAHGLASPRGAHAGDLPNLEVGAGGSGRLTATTDRATLAAGASTSLLDADGAAVVVHAAADDGTTDPAGNSGARVACGVIERR